MRPRGTLYIPQCTHPPHAAPCTGVYPIQPAHHFKKILELVLQRPRSRFLIQQMGVLKAAFPLVITLTLSLLITYLAYTVPRGLFLSFPGLRKPIRVTFLHLLYFWVFLVPRAVSGAPSPPPRTLPSKGGRESERQTERSQPLPSLSVPVILGLVLVAS